MVLFLDHTSDRQKEAMNLSSLSHNQLIRLLANEPQDGHAWREFIRRFQPYLAAVVKRECVKLGYRPGLMALDDILQDVYFKLLKNEGEAFRTFKGQYENTIWRFLEVAAMRVVYNHRRRDNAVKRPRIAGDIARERLGDLLDLFPDKNAEDEVNRIMMELAVAECLKRIGKKLRHAERDIRIIVLYLFYGMSAESIAELPEINLSFQSVFRIIADLKERLKSGLNSEN